MYIFKIILPGLLLKQKKATHFLIRMKAVTLREEGTLSETPIYLNLLRLVVVRGTVIVFFQQLQISFWNKGLKKEDPLYRKAVLKDFS